MRWKITYPQIVLVYFACMFRVFPLLFKCGIFYCNWLVTCLPPQIDCKQQKPNNAKWLPWGHIIRRESQNGNQAPLIHGPLCCSLAAGLRVLKSLFLRRNRGRAAHQGSEDEDSVLSSLTSPSPDISHLNNNVCFFRWWLMSCPTLTV